MLILIPISFKAILRQIKYSLNKYSKNGFLNDVSGVVHIGANTGHERDLYRYLGLSVIWVEPIPDIFAALQNNIEAYPNQRAFLALVSDADDKLCDFHIASNNGASSSILDLGRHKEIWPDVTYEKTISLKSITLTSLFEREQIDPCDYQALILDTQGSELLILQGSVPILKYFRYIKTEVADFEAYNGCCQLSDINGFMANHGYKERSRKIFASQPSVGNYYDIVYEKII